MTLSTNLPNLHYDKQMFKYPTQAAESERERGGEGEDPRIRTFFFVFFIFVTNLHYVDAVSVNAGAKRDRQLEIHALRPLCNFCCIRIITRNATAEPRCMPQTAQRNHVAARCCFPPARSMIRACQIHTYIFIYFF